MRSICITMGRIPVNLISVKSEDVHYGISLYNKRILGFRRIAPWMHRSKVESYPSMGRLARKEM